MIKKGEKAHEIINTTLQSRDHIKAPKDLGNPKIEQYKSLPFIMHRTRKTTTQSPTVTEKTPTFEKQSTVASSSMVAASSTAQSFAVSDPHSPPQTLSLPHLSQSRSDSDLPLLLLQLLCSLSPFNFAVISGVVAHLM